MTADLLFKIIEPSGKIYEIFPDGHIFGFADGSIVINRYPALLACGGSISQASACPTNKETESRVGAEHSFGDHFASNGEKISAAFGEK